MREEAARRAVGLGMRGEPAVKTLLHRDSRGLRHATQTGTLVTNAAVTARADFDRARIANVLRPTVLQRKCACASAAGECAERGEKPLALQAKLQIGAPDDVYEREADRVAAQVLSASGPAHVTGARPRVERAGTALQRRPDDKKKSESKTAPCDEDLLKRAKEHATQLARRAIVALEREFPLSYESRAISAHFGRLSSDQKTKVIERYKHVIDHLDGKKIRCSSDAKKTRDGDKVTDLCAQASCPGSEIVLFADFGKEVCPAGPVLLHEALHNAGACDDIDRGSKAYPPSAPEDNPYSYEYFAIDVSAGYKEPELGKRRPQAPRMQRAHDGSSVPGDTSRVESVLSRPGSGLEPRLQRDMELGFGYDLSGVRVHADAAAAESAQDVHAKAYTLGRDIVFGAGRFAPETREGRQLLAHELTHVLQQTGAAPIETEDER
jgi:hypothetical protein